MRKTVNVCNHIPQPKRPIATLICQNPYTYQNEFKLFYKCPDCGEFVTKNLSFCIICECDLDWSKEAKLKVVWE